VLSFAATVLRCIHHSSHVFAERTAYNCYCYLLSLCACRQYAAKFAGFGVTVDPQDIVTSGSALADYLKEQGITCAYVVGESLLNTLSIMRSCSPKMQSQ
jgi:hypothetical protein